MKVEDTKISMVRGDTEYLFVTCLNYELQDGDKVELTVRKKPSDVTKLIHIVTTEFTDGEANIKIKPEDTSKLAPGEYKYDIQITFANGDVKTIVPCSSFVLIPEVTYG